jgi:ketosteroid isomerase-like protein
VKVSFTDGQSLGSVLVGAPDQEIVDLESRLRRAQLDADVVTLNELISDDLLFAGPTGALATKAEDLGAHQSGAVRFRGHVPRELRIRRVDANVAITSLSADLSVEVGGAVANGTYRYTRVWAREADGKWRVVGGHVSEIQATSGVRDKKPTSP